MTKLSEIMKDRETFKLIKGRDMTHDMSSKIESFGYIDNLSDLLGNSDKEELNKCTQDMYKLATKLYSENLLSYSR